MNQQQVEKQKYEQIYRKYPEYKMGGGRQAAAEANLLSVPLYERTSYLDVGCGRGEMLQYANAHGYRRIQGVEAVPGLCGDRGTHLITQADAWSLPFNDESFTVVSCFDVIEHILPEDEIKTLEELKRVCKFHFFITANNMPSKSLGFELHVNRKPYSEWDVTLRQVFAGWDVKWLPRAPGMISETWHISQPE